MDRPGRRGEGPEDVGHAGGPVGEHNKAGMTKTKSGAGSERPAEFFSMLTHGSTLDTFLFGWSFSLAKIAALYVGLWSNREFLLFLLQRQWRCKR